MKLFEIKSPASPNESNFQNMEDVRRHCKADCVVFNCKYCTVSRITCQQLFQKFYDKNIY